MVRVAVLQIERSPTPGDSLAACIAQIERAVLQHRADILVCPELAFAPHEGSEPAALTCETFRHALQQRATTHGVWIAISLTLGADSFRGWLAPETENASEPALRDGALAVTPHGKLGLCAGRAFLQTTEARALANDGVVLICAPAGICSAAQAGLHLSARALENGVFVALATSFEPSLQPYPTDSLTLPPTSTEAMPATRGATSQIIGPNGRPLAVAVVEEAGLAVAELDLSESARESASAGAESSLWQLRRPEIYRSAATRERTQGDPAIWTELSVATVEAAFSEGTQETLASAAAKIELLAERGVGLVVLPELFCFDADLQGAAEAAADDFLTVIRALARACGNSGIHVVTSLVEAVSGELTHVGVVVGQAGVVARQVQLHVPTRHAWARAGRRIENICMPWGNFAIAVGEDALMPELAHSYSALGTTLLAAPMSSRFLSHARVTLPALADQLQCGVVAALRPASATDEDDRTASLLVDPRQGALSKAFAVDGICSARLTLRRPADGRFARRSPSAYRAAI